MDSYDNDGLLLVLDDDLFWIEIKKDESLKVNTEINEKCGDTSITILQGEM